MTQRARSGIASTDVFAMFPSFVWKAQIDEAVREEIDAKVTGLLVRSMPELRRGEGWQSDTALQRLDELAPLLPCIRDLAANVLRFLRIGCDVEALEITGCWATVLGPGAQHRAHSHPNNFLSGVYYLRSHPGADSISFHDPRPQTGILRPPVVELTNNNTDLVVVRVAPGTLLLFPSWIVHSVDANTSDANRISVSFNLMFSAFTDLLAKPLWGP